MKGDDQMFLRTYIVKRRGDILGMREKGEKDIITERTIEGGGKILKMEDILVDKIRE